MTGGKRKRNNDATAENYQNENPNDELNSKIEILQKSVNDIQESQKTQESILKELLEKMDKTERSEDSDAKKKQSFNSVISPGSLMRNISKTGMPPVGRSFVLKHVFENVLKSDEMKRQYSEEEEHFGVPWNMFAYTEDQHIDFFLKCNKSWDIKKWAIDTMCTVKFIEVNGKTEEGNFEAVYENFDEDEPSTEWGLTMYKRLEELKKDFLVDNKLTAEIYVKINKMTGIYKENLRSFDETTKNYSDVVLIVKDQKFHVSKLFLASHSTYFDSLFLGQFQESNKSEIELTGIEPEDFQKFLEAVYGYSVVDEFNVEGIVMLADMYDTSIVVEKCEDFMLEKSQKSNKKKLQMAIRYNLDKLKKKCLSEIKTVADIKSVIPGKLEDLEPSIMAEFFGKLISLS